MKITDFSSSDLDFCLPSPLEPLRLAHWPDNAPTVWVKRDDSIHPIISGNKWRKLNYLNLHEHNHIVSIGGGFSNHLHALGYVCRQAGISFTALVRGNYQASMTPMLQDLQLWGCQIRFITKAEYQQRDTPAFSLWLAETFPQSLFIPEGGSSASAIQGVSEIMSEITQQLPVQPTHIVAPVASGATLAGLALGAVGNTEIVGIAVLKGQDYLHQQVQRFLPESVTNWQINHNFTHGGYAKKSPALSAFCKNFTGETQIAIEPVYSGKLFYALDQMITANYFSSTEVVVALHTGGLQGARNLNG